MKRIGIAGAHSYIGESLSAWLAQTPERFETVTADVRGEGWRSFDWTGLDAVVLVAGIAHQAETPDNAPLYEAVNHRLAVEIATRAKANGVGQFVLFSTMSVYGLTVGRIGADTPTAPTTAYGHSKLNAEQDIAALADELFHVAVLRPPMIYGRGCRGNYPKLAALARKTPVFPRVANERSMLYIDVLCRFMARLLESGAGGLYFPQNAAYVCTDALVAAVAVAHGRRLWRPRGFGWLLKALARRGAAIGKVFGSLTYDQRLSMEFREQTEPTLEETVRATEADA